MSKYIEEKKDYRANPEGEAPSMGNIPSIIQKRERII